MRTSEQAGWVGGDRGHPLGKLVPPRLVMGNRETPALTPDGEVGLQFP